MLPLPSGVSSSANEEKPLDLTIISLPLQSSKKLLTLEGRSVEELAYSAFAEPVTNCTSSILISVLRSFSVSEPMVLTAGAGAPSVSPIVITSFSSSAGILAMPSFTGSKPS